MDASRGTRSKHCALRSGRFSLRFPPRKRDGSPLRTASSRLSATMPDCHLEHTLIPRVSPARNSLGAFPQVFQRLLSSFAEVVSKGCPFIPDFHARQATLHTVLPAMQVPAQVVPRAARAAKHIPESPRKQGFARMPLRVAPSSLTSSASPQLGVGSRYQRLHRYAIDGFLAPSSESPRPTRILRDLHPHLNLTRL